MGPYVFWTTIIRTSWFSVTMAFPSSSYSKLRLHFDLACFRSEIDQERWRLYGVRLLLETGSNSRLFVEASHHPCYFVFGEWNFWFVIGSDVWWRRLQKVSSFRSNLRRHLWKWAMFYHNLTPKAHRNPTSITKNEQNIILVELLLVNSQTL